MTNRRFFLRSNISVSNNSQSWTNFIENSGLKNNFMHTIVTMGSECEAVEAVEAIIKEISIEGKPLGDNFGDKLLKPNAEGLSPFHLASKEGNFKFAKGTSNKQYFKLVPQIKCQFLNISDQFMYFY